MIFVEIKLTYEWYTPTGRRREFYDFGLGVTQEIAINNVKKHIKQRIRHENYKILKTEAV